MKNLINKVSLFLIEKQEEIKTMLEFISTLIDFIDFLF